MPTGVKKKVKKYVKLCNCRPERQFHLYTDIDELLANEKIDFAVTALPTYLHTKMAVKLMDKGIHVFTEKPMALLKKPLGEGKYGKVIRAEFLRISKTLCGPDRTGTWISIRVVRLP